jgi:hypothetical protein
VHILDQPINRLARRQCEELAGKSLEHAAFGQVGCELGRCVAMVKRYAEQGGEERKRLREVRDVAALLASQAASRHHH